MKTLKNLPDVHANCDANRRTLEAWRGGFMKNYSLEIKTYVVVVHHWNFFGRPFGVCDRRFLSSNVGMKNWRSDESRWDNYKRSVGKVLWFQVCEWSGAGSCSGVSTTAQRNFAGTRCSPEVAMCHWSMMHNDVINRQPRLSTRPFVASPHRLQSPVASSGNT